MEKRIMTQHPEGKIGVNITQEKYDVMRQAILDSLRVHGERDFKEMIEDVRTKLGKKFDGSISWYVTTVKLDLEARGIIQRIPGETPQRLRLVQD
jgi:hypothetical protein